MMDEHFSAVASRYRELRTLDPEPVHCIRDHLPDCPLRGVDVGCGTGRYTQRLCDELPEGTLILAADQNSEMLRELRHRLDGETRIVPVQLRAEDLPLRPRSIDWLTTFNAVHHMNLPRFLAMVAEILRPGGKLFIYTRTPEQNARSVWGRLFPGFSEKETRLRSEPQLRAAVENAAGLELESVETFRYKRTSGPQRLREQAENAHYSTFSMYESEEFSEALQTFLGRFDDTVVHWSDENLMLICKRT